MADRDGNGAIVKVANDEAGGSSSKSQKTFNRWIEKIEARKRELAEWQSLARDYSSKLAGEYDPLLRKILDLRILLLRRFDSAHADDALTRREQQRLSSTIIELAIPWIEDDASAELIRIHDAHSRMPYDERRRAPRPDSINDLSIDHDEAEPEWDDEPWRTPSHSARHDRSGDAEARPRSANAQARHERRQRAAEGATRSVRDVYRKLASALHPDREPDPLQQVRKTALMQRVNQAYQDKDLVRLLNLQIEVEQIDLTDLAGLSDARLLHYNRVLKEQAEDLDHEIADLIAPFAAGLDRALARKLTPTGVLDALQRDIGTLRREQQQLAQDVALFKDVRTIKAWLKHLRPTRGGRD